MRTLGLIFLGMGCLIQGTVKELPIVSNRKLPEIKIVNRNPHRQPPQSLTRIEESAVKRYCDFSWLWRLCSGHRR